MNALIDATIQQGEAHKEFAQRIKVDCVGAFNDCLED